MNEINDQEVEKLLGAELNLFDLYGNAWFPLKDSLQAQEIVYAMINKGYCYDQSLDKGKIVTRFLKEIDEQGGICEHKSINHSVCYAAFMALVGGAGESLH